MVGWLGMKEEWQLNEVRRKNKTIKKKRENETIEKIIPKEMNERKKEEALNKRKLTGAKTTEELYEITHLQVRS